MPYIRRYLILFYLLFFILKTGDGRRLSPFMGDVSIYGRCFYPNPNTNTNPNSNSIYFIKKIDQNQKYSSNIPNTSSTQNTSYAITAAVASINRLLCSCYEPPAITIYLRSMLIKELTHK